jgi:hypothetical protein
MTILTWMITCRRWGRRGTRGRWGTRTTRSRGKKQDEADEEKWGR